MNDLQGKRIRRIGIVCAVAIAVGLWAPSTSAETMYGGFNIIEPQNSGLGEELEQQFEVEVHASDVDGWAEFTFFNYDLGDSIPSVITAIYWEAVIPPALDYYSEYTALALNWLPDGTPVVLPGGENIQFLVEFVSDPRNPAPHNGIGVGESATFRIALADSADYLLTSLYYGTMRLGMHVTGIGTNGQYSDSFATGTSWGIDPDDPFVPPPVPVPAAAGIGFLGMGLVGLAQGYRRLRR